MNFTLSYMRKLLRSEALRYPGATETISARDGRVVKVEGKTFVVLGHDEPDPEGDLVMTVLPRDGAVVLTLPRVEPTPGALGEAGWVTARHRRAGEVPLELLMAWMDQSYQAVASKRLLAELPAARAVPRDNDEPEWVDDATLVALLDQTAPAYNKKKPQPDPAKAPARAR